MGAAFSLPAATLRCGKADAAITISASAHDAAAEVQTLHLHSLAASEFSDKETAFVAALDEFHPHLVEHTMAAVAADAAASARSETTPAAGAAARLECGFERSHAAASAASAVTSRIAALKARLLQQRAAAERCMAAMEETRGALAAATAAVGASDAARLRARDEAAADRARMREEARALSSLPAVSEFYGDISTRIAALERDRQSRMLCAVAALVAGAGAAAAKADTDAVAAAATTTSAAAGRDAAEGACDAAGAGTTTRQAGSRDDDSVSKGSALAKRLGDAVLNPGRDALLAMDLQQFAHNVIDNAEKRDEMLATIAAFRAL